MRTFYEESCLNCAYQTNYSFSVKVDRRVVHQFEASCVHHKGVVLFQLFPLSFSKFHLVVNTLGAHSPDMEETLRVVMEDHSTHTCIEFKARLSVEHCRLIEVNDHEFFCCYISIGSSENSNLGFIRLCAQSCPRERSNFWSSRNRDWFPII